MCVERPFSRCGSSSNSEACLNSCSTISCNSLKNGGLNSRSRLGPDRGFGVLWYLNHTKPSKRCRNYTTVVMILALPAAAQETLLWPNPEYLPPLRECPA